MFWRCTSPGMDYGLRRNDGGGGNWTDGRSRSDFVRSLDAYTATVIPAKAGIHRGGKVPLTNSEHSPMAVLTSRASIANLPYALEHLVLSGEELHGINRRSH